MTSQKTILFWVPRIYNHDGVSQDLLRQVRLCQQNSFHVKVFCLSSEIDLGDLIVSLEEAKRIFQSPHNILVCQYSGFDKTLLANIFMIRSRFILRYQNVTPAKWFWRYSLRAAIYAWTGRLLAKLLVYFGAVDLFMPASEFSLQDLTSKWFGTLKPARMEVVPILFDGPMTSISSDSAKNGESQVLNNKVSGHKNSFVGLFVGRFVPNKGVELLIDVIQKWHTKKSQETEKKIILIVAGKVTPGFEFYFEELQAKIKFLGLIDCIHFTIDPSQDVLKRHFAEADFFICASRHEGFCMPIIEAQMAGLPVIALNSTAVPETMGLGGLVVEQGKDQIEDFCARIEEVLTNPELRLKLVQSGKENLARFDSSKVGAKFLGLLNV